MKNKKLYYEKQEGQFYYVSKRPKSILIEWAEHKTPQTYNGNGDILSWFYHDFSVKWDNDFVSGNGMIISTAGKNKKHCLVDYEDDYILIYPYQAGQPFCLETATKENIKKEIKDNSFSSEDYYNNLLKELDKEK